MTVLELIELLEDLPLYNEVQFEVISGGPDGLLDETTEADGNVVINIR